MPDLTPDHELTTAADIVASAGEQTTATPWRLTSNFLSADASGCIAVTYLNDADAPWMALTDPSMAPPLAAVFNHAARRWRTETRPQAGGWYHEACDGVCGEGTDEDCACFEALLTLARHFIRRHRALAGR